MQYSINNIPHNNLQNNALNNLNFKGKAPSAADLTAVAKRTRCALGSFVDDLTKKVQKKSPNSLENINDFLIPKQEKFTRTVIEAGRDFLEMPFDVIDSVASRFPNSKINNASFLKRYRVHNLKENELKALQGLYEDGLKFLNSDKINPDGLRGPKKIFNKKLNKKVCTDNCRDFCRKFADEYDALLNKTMAWSQGAYDTKKERFFSRIISGFTAAIFLGNDFYNSAKLKGKSDEDAKKSQNKKQAQEIKENLLEGVLGYGVAACLTKFVNANLWTSALISTGISLVSRIVSRKMSGMPLNRVNVPENSMNEFMKAAKNNEQYKTQSEKDKEAAKPILSLKNILLAFGGIVAAGFTLHGLKYHTKAGKYLNNKISSFTNKIADKDIEKLYASKKDIKTITKILKQNGEGAYAARIESNIDYKNNKVYLGETYKTTKLFGKLEVKTKDLKSIPLVPFKMVKDIVGYPYTLAKKFASAFGLIKHGEPNKRSLEDVHNMKNLYLRFKDFESKYKGDPQKLNEEFGKYVNKMRLASLNNVTISKVNNSKIAVMAQTLGTLVGIGFNMNDEFNASIKNGDSKQDAEKAARKRGLNKFARMTSQVAISGTLNSLFEKQYGDSLIGAGLVVALSTVITDSVSRLLTAMPTKKMNKKELEEYQEKNKTGKMAWYHNSINKLAS